MEYNDPARKQLKHGDEVEVYEVQRKKWYRTTIDALPGGDVGLYGSVYVTPFPWNAGGCYPLEYVRLPKP